MGTIKNKIGFSEKAQREFDQTKKALLKVAKEMIADTKAKNTHMVIADEKGNIQKIAGKDL